MADTFTSRMRFRKPEVGANNNTWGTLLNEDALDLIDYAFAGRLPVTIDTADVTLTEVDGESDESRAAAIILSGTLTGNRNLILPTDAGSKVYVVINNTTGAFSVTFKTQGGPGVVVPQDGKAYWFYRDSDADGIKAVMSVKGALTDTAQIWTAAQIPGRVTLTDAATIAVNMALGNSFIVTLGGNRTLGNPTNVNQGQYFDVLVLQDGTGGRTLAHGSNYRAPSGAFPTVTATAGRASLLSYYAYSATRIFLIGATLDFNPT